MFYIRTVAFSKLMDDIGLVVGIDHIPELVKLSMTNISKSHKNLIDEGKIILDIGDGRFGYKSQAPYDVINVGAGKFYF